MKSGRQRAILEILEQNPIDTQFKLMEVLAERGFFCTQATLSRDIRELKLVKRQNDEGRMTYQVAVGPDEAEDGTVTLWEKHLVSADMAQNLVVVKVFPGTAALVCDALEASNPQNLVGTIAGQDTVFLAMRDIQSARKLCAQLQKLL